MCCASLRGFCTSLRNCSTTVRASCCHVTVSAATHFANEWNACKQQTHTLKTIAWYLSKPPKKQTKKYGIA
jgi:hypothetical protein